MKRERVRKNDQVKWIEKRSYSDEGTKLKKSPKKIFWAICKGGYCTQGKTLLYVSMCKGFEIFFRGVIDLVDH